MSIETRALIAVGIHLIGAVITLIIFYKTGEFEEAVRAWWWYLLGFAVRCYISCVGVVGISFILICHMFNWYTH